MEEIEAESLGKPLIATDLGFSSEAVIDGQNGRKVPLGDTDGFVRAIRAMWNDPEMCRTMGAYARADYESKYRPEDNYRRLIKIYEQTITQTKSAAKAR